MKSIGLHDRNVNYTVITKFRYLFIVPEIVIIGRDIDLDLDRDDDPSPETEEAAVIVADLEVDHVIVNALAVIVQDLRNQEKKESDLEVETRKEAEEVEVETVKKKREGIYRPT